LGHADSGTPRISESWIDQNRDADGADLALQRLLFSKSCHMCGKLGVTFGDEDVGHGPPVLIDCPSGLPSFHFPGSTLKLSFWSSDATE
jgi:hypothetical protein